MEKEKIIIKNENIASYYYKILIKLNYRLQLKKA